MLVQAGIPFAINYTSFDQNEGLFVASKVYDITDPVPVLIDTLEMDHVALGSYAALFTPVQGRVYSCISAVYLDAPFTTPDPQRSPVTLTAEVVDLSSFSSLVGFLNPRAVVGEDLLSPDDFDVAIEVFIGDAVNRVIQLFTNSDPVDLSTALEILVSLQNDPSQPVQFLHATKTSGKIVIQDALSGRIRLVLGAADTAGLLVGEHFDLDITVTDAGGKKQSHRVPRGFTVKATNP